MGKMPTNALGKSYELKLHCFCLFDAYSMPKDKFSVVNYLPYSSSKAPNSIVFNSRKLKEEIPY